MSLKICSIASSSSGNCIFISSEKTSLLIDCGIAFSHIDKGLRLLGVSKSTPISVLITHNHTDHIRGLEVLEKNTGAKIFSEAKDIKIGDIEVTPFSLSHDVPCLGYTLTSGGKRISVLTDFGKLDTDIIDHISYSDILFIESNHDEQMLKKNRSYSTFLKRRILSETGHLSNKDCATIIREAVKNRVKTIMLGHLSDSNNTPDLAYNTAAQAITEEGKIVEKDILLEVAPKNKLSGVYKIS